MQWLLKTEVAWLRSHAEADSNGRWKCKTTGTPIASGEVEYPLDPTDKNGLEGKIVVTHVACRTCNPKVRNPVIKRVRQDELEQL